jgi:hypothetical protein
MNGILKALAAVIMVGLILFGIGRMESNYRQNQYNQQVQTCQENQTTLSGQIGCTTDPSDPSEP